MAAPVVPRVAVYSSKKYDRESLTAARSGAGDHTVEWTFFDFALDQTTARLAAGHHAVCIFVNDTADERVLEILAELGVKSIALRCAGYNNVSLPSAARLAITVARVPSYSPSAIAEFAVGMLLTIVRKYHKGHNRVREGNFMLDGLLGFELRGKTIGIVGTGQIGLLTGKILALGFGCTVLAHDPYPAPERAREHGIAYVAGGLEELLPQCDVVSLHCPLIGGEGGNRYMMNDETLGMMKEGAILINTSRGGLIDTLALIRALKSGRLGAVGLDVYEKESEHFFHDASGKIMHDDVFARLLSFYNVFVSGHQAFLTEEALAKIASTTIQNIWGMVNGCPEKGNVLVVDGTI